MDLKLLVINVIRGKEDNITLKKIMLVILNPKIVIVIGIIIVLISYYGN